MINLTSLEKYLLEFSPLQMQVLDKTKNWHDIDKRRRCWLNWKLDLQASNLIGFIGYLIRF